MAVVVTVDIIIPNHPGISIITTIIFLLPLLLIVIIVLIIMTVYVVMGHKPFKDSYLLNVIHGTKRNLVLRQRITRNAHGHLPKHSLQADSVISFMIVTL